MRCVSVHRGLQRHQSLGGNKYAQVFAIKDFSRVAYPMESKSSVGDALRPFVQDFERTEYMTSAAARMR